jgi:hypothetical protein
MAVGTAPATAPVLAAVAAAAPAETSADAPTVSSGSSVDADTLDASVDVASVVSLDESVLDAALALSLDDAVVSHDVVSVVSLDESVLDAALAPSLDDASLQSVEHALVLWLDESLLDEDLDLSLAGSLGVVALPRAQRTARGGGAGRSGRADVLGQPVRPGRHRGRHDGSCGCQDAGSIVVLVSGASPAPRAPQSCRTSPAADRPVEEAGMPASSPRGRRAARRSATVVLSHPGTAVRTVERADRPTRLDDGQTSVHEKLATVFSGDPKPTSGPLEYVIVSPTFDIGPRMRTVSCVCEAYFHSARRSGVRPAFSACAGSLGFVRDCSRSIGCCCARATSAALIEYVLAVGSLLA